jgi:DNA-binding NarL/FixJ family response regulator
VAAATAGYAALAVALAALHAPERGIDYVWFYRVLAGCRGPGRWCGRGSSAGPHGGGSKPQAVTAVRTRIARELHDVITRDVTAMVVRGAAGRLRGLVEATRQAGQPGSLIETGVAAELDGAAALAACRVVQESLASALKHAFGGEAAVRVSYSGEGTGIDVRTDGPGAAAPAKVLIVTTFNPGGHVHEALQAGAGGFLLKDAPPPGLTAAVRAAAAGGSLPSPALTRQLTGRSGSRTRPAGGPGPPARRAAPRERAVLKLIAAGPPNAEIAGARSLSAETAKTCVSRILARPDLRDRVQAVVFACQEGPVAPER